MFVTAWTPQPDILPEPNFSEDEVANHEASRQIKPSSHLFHSANQGGEASFLHTPLSKDDFFSSIDKNIFLIKYC